MTLAEARTLLDLDPDADQRAISKAFQRRIRLHHPDVAGPEKTDLAARLNTAHRLLYDVAANRAHFHQPLPDPWAPRTVVDRPTATIPSPGVEEAAERTAQLHAWIAEQLATNSSRHRRPTLSPRAVFALSFTAGLVMVIALLAVALTSSTLATGATFALSALALLGNARGDACIWGLVFAGLGVAAAAVLAVHGAPALTVVAAIIAPICAPVALRWAWVNTGSDAEAADA
ncbi:hypothetical protein D7I44_07670 [Gryllotalpicola protaetiae]|uniref:J domain-containing protein n=2 Tax=Gryllotalpicola protaetiae TaxID=2419771 RepID=A0A387BHC3_9MICO|nr:hypothetical protein D7I44_07670 [Gryllotalpicola protaetiae]